MSIVNNCKKVHFELQNRKYFDEIGRADFRDRVQDRADIGDRALSYPVYKLIA